VETTDASAAGNQRQGGLRVIAGLFLLLFGFYVFSGSGHIHTIDSYQLYNVTKSLAERNDLDIPRSYMAVQGVDDRYYSKLGVGQSLLAWPLYKLTHALYARVPATLTTGIEGAQGQVRVRLDGREAQPQYLALWPRTRDDPFCSALVLLLFNPLVTALGMALLAALLRELGYGRRAVVATVLATAVGTYAWVLSRDFFQHPLVLALLLATVLLWIQARGHPGPGTAFAMGIMGGLAVLTRVFSVAWAPLILAALIHEIRRGHLGWKRGCAVVGAYLAPLFAGGLVVLWFNWLRFGSPTLSGYHTGYDQGGFSTPLGIGVWVNLFSAERSIFLYAPPLLLAIFAIPAFFRRHRSLARFASSLTIIYLVGYGKWWSYDGGWCIGPRFLLPVVPLLMLPAAELLDRPAGDLRRRVALAGLILLALSGAALQIVLMSPEYTAMYTLNGGRMYSPGDAVRALSQSGRWGLDYFYVNLWGQVPFIWYALLAAVPAVSIIGGISALRSTERRAAGPARSPSG
jgi:hypothetical protein